MALVQRLEGLKMKNRWHHRVPHEKMYKLCRFGGSTLKTFGADLGYWAGETSQSGSGVLHS
jgi:hypothetical protein